MLIPEGNSGTFTIERSAGSSGECTVYWSLSDDGTDDMNQTNGSVVFANVSITHSTCVDCTGLLISVHVVI